MFKHTGVTVVTDEINVNATKAPKLFVKHRPRHTVAVNQARKRTNGLRLTRSPSGQRKSRPAA